MKNIRTSRGRTIAEIAMIVILMVIAVGLIVKSKNVTYEREMNWIEMQQHKLGFTFDDTAMYLLPELTDWNTILSQLHSTSFDFDGDGTEENVMVSFIEKENGIFASIETESVGSVEMQLDQYGSTVFSVVGMEKEGAKYLAAVESVLPDDGTKGFICCRVWKVSDGRLEKSHNIYYSGVIGDSGMMAQGTISNDLPEDCFAYNAEDDMNGYIYERSRIIADMRELGIKFPYETIGNHIVSYKKEVFGLYNIIISVKQM